MDWKNVTDVEGLAALVVEIMTEAHDNLAQAQVTSRQRGEAVYGLIWRSLGHDLVVRLRQERLEVQVLKPASSPYELPVLGDALLVPWRPAGGHSPTDVPFGTSPTRQRLWQQPLPQDLLPLEMANPDDHGDGHAGDDHAAHREDAEAHEGDLPGEEDVEMTTDDLAQVVAEAERRHLRVVIVAMRSDARRLRCIEWGEAELADDGVLQWSEGSPETLYSIADAAAPTSVSPQTFTEGEAPTPGVTLKPRAQPKTADGSTTTGAISTADDGGAGSVTGSSDGDGAAGDGTDVGNVDR